MIIDLRFVRSDEHGAIKLGGLLAESEFEIILAGQEAPKSLPVAPAELGQARGMRVALVNRDTAGPVEAVLASLQRRGELFLVGEKTRGDTGRFRPSPEHPEWTVIDADFRPAADQSLLGLGLDPGLSVSVTPAEDAKAYTALDRGAAVSSLLDTAVEKTRFDEARLLRQHSQTGDDRRPRVIPLTPAPAPPDAPAQSSEGAREQALPETPVDRILHRAVNTMVALRALRRLPDT